MATRAILANLATMFVLMAARALTRESEVRTIEVFDEYSTPRGGRNEVHLVAARASDAGVLPGECETGLAVI